MSASTGKPVVRPYEDHDRDAVLDLLAAAFARPRSQFERIWRRQIEENPHCVPGGVDRYVLSRPPVDHVAGFIGVLPMRMTVERETYHIQHPVDYAVEDESRFYGIKLLYGVLGRLPFYLTSSAGPVSVALFRKYGCGEVTLPAASLRGFDLGFLPSGLQVLYAKLLRRLARRRQPLLAWIPGLLHRVRGRSAGHASPQVRRVDHFGEAMLAGAARLRSGLFRLDKTAEWLNWRYVDWPRCQDETGFEALVATLAGKTGYVVWRRGPGGATTIYDLDYAGDPSIGACLLHTVIDRAFRAGCIEVNAPCFPVADRQVLQDAGFDVNQTNQVTLLYAPQPDTALERMSSPDFWAVYYGDLEVSHFG